MKQVWYAICAVSSWLVAAQPATASLFWENAEVAIKAKVDQKVAVAEYSFCNRSSSVVTIVSVLPSCDCVTARTSGFSFAPGERGTVYVEFVLGGRDGVEEKMVYVTTNDTIDHPQRLLLTVKILQSVELSQRFVFWKVDDSPVEKIIDIVISDISVAGNCDVQCASSTFTAWLEPLSEKGRFSLHIKPTTTASVAQATIRLNATIGNQPRVFVLSAGVK